MRIREIAFRTFVVLVLILAFFAPFEGPKPFEGIRALVEAKAGLVQHMVDPKTGKDADYMNIFLKENADGSVDPKDVITLTGDKQIQEYWLQSYQRHETEKLMVYKPLSWAQFSAAFPDVKMESVYAHNISGGQTTYVDSGKKTIYPESKFFFWLNLLLAPLCFLLFVFAAYTYLPEFSTAKIRAILYVSVAAILGLCAFLVKSYFLINRDVSFLQQYVAVIVPPKPFPGSGQFSNIAYSYFAFVAITLAIVFPKSGESTPNQ